MGDCLPALGDKFRVCQVEAVGVYKQRACMQKHQEMGGLRKNKMSFSEVILFLFSSGKWLKVNLEK